MPLITQDIKTLKGGISQQPDVLRFPDQGQEQVNGYSSEVKGLVKRPPSKHIARLRNTLNERPLVRMINRDEFERYYVMFRPGTGGIQIWDLDGNQKTVNAPTGFGYIQTDNPRRDIRMVTIADYTFVVNRAVTVLEDSSEVAHPGYNINGQALFNIKSGQYGRTYKVYVDGVQKASYTTPDGSLPEHAGQIDTQFITGQLATQLTANLPDYTVSLGPNWIKIAKNSGSISTIKTEDGWNGGLLQGCIFDVQRFNMLPAQAPDGYIVRVSGDPGSGADDYYIRFDATTNVWKETIRPGVYTKLLGAVMPHVLVREADGSFTFRRATWEPRTCGDDDSNPLPSFVDNNIADVFFFRNRLGLIAGENVILTKSGEFFSFFPKSVVAVSDTDPIDVAVSHNRVSILNHAVPFTEELLLWSDQTQFVLRSDGVMTSKSVRVDQATEFESAIAARPVAAGRSVYFAAPRASFTSVRRYYSVQDVSAVKNAEDVSAHVPDYVPNGVFFLGSSTTENVVTVLTEGKEHHLYLYKYLYLNEQIAQQSWSHWDFGSESRILACEFVGAVMHLMIDAPSGLFLETIEFTQDTKDLPEEPYRLYMDRKLLATGTYDGITDETVFNLADIYGQAPAKGSYWVVRTDGKAWFTPEPEGGWTAPAEIRLKGNLSSGMFIVGEAFTFRYVFSKFLYKIEDQNGIKTEQSGRLQVRRAWVNHENTGGFTVDVCGEFQYGMTGKILGALTLGTQGFATGQFRFPVMKHADDCRVTVESYLPTPVTIIGAGWTGAYFRRTQIV